MPAAPKDDGFLRLLGTLPRHPAPEIPIEGLLRRLLWRRVRVGAAVFLAVAGPLLALLLLREKPEPPVHLKLRIVEFGEPVDLPARDPPELNLP